MTAKVNGSIAMGGEVCGPGDAPVSWIRSFPDADPHAKTNPNAMPSTLKNSLSIGFMIPSLSSPSAGQRARADSELNQ